MPPAWKHLAPAPAHFLPPAESMPCKQFPGIVASIPNRAGRHSIVDPFSKALSRDSPEPRPQPPPALSVRRAIVMRSQAIDGRSASKCQRRCVPDHQTDRTRTVDDSRCRRNGRSRRSSPARRGSGSRSNPCRGQCLSAGGGRAQGRSNSQTSR